jgi:hypothetical protein
VLYKGKRRRHWHVNVDILTKLHKDKEGEHKVVMIMWRGTISQVKKGYFCYYIWRQTFYGELFATYGTRTVKHYKSSFAKYKETIWLNTVTNLF